MQYSRKQNKLCLVIKETRKRPHQEGEGHRAVSADKKYTKIRGTDCVALIVIIVVIVHVERKRS